MMNVKCNSSLHGLRFFGSDGSLLLEVCPVSMSKNRYNPNIETNSLILHEGERVIGLKSSGRSYNRAYHFNLQWIIGRKPPELTILKLLVNKKAINLSSSFRKIPNGVGREVIKY